MLQHRVAEAAAIFHELLLRAAEIGDRRALAKLAREIGRCHQLAGDVAAAVRCYALQIAVGLELGERRDLSVGLGFLAGAYAQAGDAVRAARVGELAVALCDSIRLVYWACEFRQDLARLRFAQGRLAEAEALNEQALATAATLGTNKSAQLEARILRARLRAAQGEQTPAQAAAELAALDEEWFGDRERAALCYAVWRLDPARSAARRAAAELYSALATSAPTAETLARATELTGVAAPAPPPLPALPELIDGRRYDLAALIEQAEAMAAATA
jgi:hypothetical protein